MLEMKVERLNYDQCAETFMMFIEPENPNNSWSNSILKDFPEMNIAGITKSQVAELLEKRFASQQNEIEQNISRNMEWWKKEGQTVIGELMKKLDLKTLLSKKTELLWQVDLCPNCPRSIEDWSFRIPASPDWSLKDFQSLAIHEILHFLWFDRVQQLDNIRIKESSNDDDPIYLKYWYLSEIVIDPILNDTQMTRDKDIKWKSYNEFYKICLDGRPLMQTIKDQWESRKDFADFHKQSSAYIFNNIDELETKYNNFFKKPDMSNNL